MTSLQKRILCVMVALSFVVNSGALAVGVWCAHDLAKQGISIESILAEGKR